MADIFLRLFNRSIAAGWLILAVVLLRLLLKKTPKWISCLLWGLVAVRLVCPFSIESVYSLIPSERVIQTEVVIEGEFQQEIPAVDTRMSAASKMLNPVLSETFMPSEEEHVISWQLYRNIAGIVWCCGFCLLSAYAMINWCRIRHMVKEAVRYKDNIYYCDAVASPFIFGIVRARIYLPSSIDAINITHVLQHEQAHLKRKDHWWKPLGYLLLSVYWFQPLCWVAYFIFCRDIEFACDEKVIRAMSLNEKKEYAKALLSYSLQRRMVMACPVAFGEISVKKRIKSVLYYRKRPVWILVPAIAVCMIVAVCFLTNPPHEIRGVSVAAGNVLTSSPVEWNIETNDEKEQMQNTIGVQIVLPENTNWIKDICYYYKDSNSMEIQYYDAILEADCTLYAVQNGTVELPDITFDRNLEESWEGWTADSQRIPIQVQRSEDGRNVLVTWEYNDSQFAMQAVVSDINEDVSPFPKTAIHIIQNFQAGSSSE